MQNRLREAQQLPLLQTPRSRAMEHFPSGQVPQFGADTSVTERPRQTARRPDARQPDSKGFHRSARNSSTSCPPSPFEGQKGVLNEAWRVRHRGRADCVKSRPLAHGKTFRDLTECVDTIG
jgi:hypothetical protein